MSEESLALSLIREKTHMRKSLRISDFTNLVVILTLVVAGIWYRHGALDGYSISAQAAWQSTAQILGLYAQLSAIFAIVLASRAAYLEKAIGLDNMLVWHRWVGEAAAVFLVTHIIGEIIALHYSTGYIQAILTLTGKQNYMAHSYSHFTQIYQEKIILRDLVLYPSACVYIHLFRIFSPNKPGL